MFQTYVHRSGRTARANHEGLTLLLIETDEQRQYVRLMKTLNRGVSYVTVNCRTCFFGLDLTWTQYSF